MLVITVLRSWRELISGAQCLVSTACLMSSRPMGDPVSKERAFLRMTLQAIIFWPPPLHVQECKSKRVHRHIHTLEKKKVACQHFFLQGCIRHEKERNLPFEPRPVKFVLKKKSKIFSHFYYFNTWRIYR